MYPPGITHEDIVEGTVNANILENIKDLHGLVFLKTVLASGMYGEKEKRSCLNYTGCKVNESIIMCRYQNPCGLVSCSVP